MWLYEAACKESGAVLVPEAPGLKAVLSGADRMLSP